MPSVGVSRKTLARVGAALSILIGVIVVVALLVSSGGSSDDAKANDDGGAAAPAKTVDVPNGDQPTGTQVEQSAAAEYLLGQGYKLNQFSFTIDKPVYKERGAASVSEQPILTEQQLRTWIQSGSERSKAYLKYVKENLSEQDYNRIRRGEGFVRIQLLVPSEYEKNSYFNGARVVGTTERRSVEAGDVIFLYVGKATKKKQPNGREEESADVKEAGNTRGPCGNPHAVPVPVSGPPAPPVTVPPREPPEERVPPHEPPEEEHPGKPQIPIRDIPGAHEAGHGKDLPPKSESEYKGPPPRVKPANPPVVTPPGTGGVIKPGESPPQNDSKGGTVKPPTVPPTSQPDEPASTTPAPQPSGGAPPPPPPE